jgi:hypothetical protein
MPKSVTVSMSENSWTKSETRVSMHDTVSGLRLSMHDTAADHCVNAGRASVGSRLPLDSAYEWACCEPRNKDRLIEKGLRVKDKQDIIDSRVEDKQDIIDSGRVLLHSRRIMLHSALDIRFSRR